MSAGFMVAKSVELTGFRCALCGAAAAAGIGCAVWGCAAWAEENREFNRTADPPNRRQETAAIVRTDERRKKILPNALIAMLSRMQRTR
jgi:hypothetical protein